mmetsp:Transcript_79790/g.234724  ORF Transcript_79790/g.234724 Transcript_79790/m.234724 type:complete len:209 (+) Transcript_79790:84-710(+)
MLWRAPSTLMTHTPCIEGMGSSHLFNICISHDNGLNFLWNCGSIRTIPHLHERELPHCRIDQDRCGDYERCCDAEVHQERQQHSHIQGESVDVVDGRPHVFRNDVSFQGANHRKVESNACFKDKEGKEANDDVRAQDDDGVARCRNHHGYKAYLLNRHHPRQVGKDAASQHAHDHETREDMPKWRRRHSLLHQTRSPVEDEDEHRGLE